MSQHTFEIRPQQSGEHLGPADDRLGTYAIWIDGLHTEYYHDPMQAYPTCLKQALGEGLAPGGEAERRALELCAQRAEHCLNRVVQHIQDGSLLPGGVPLGSKGLDTSQLPGAKNQSGVASKRIGRRDEKEAVVAFLNRGRLKGLDAAQRKAREVERNTVRDHSIEWRERRMALIAARQAELEQLQQEVAANPAKRGKLERSIVQLRNELAALSAPVLNASHGFQKAYYRYLHKEIDLVNDDIRIVPCMTNTTCDTQRDAINTYADITTPDEFDGSGYSTGGQALDTQAINVDDANDRAEFDADDEAATLGAGTRSIQGNLLISFVATLGGSYPLHWIEYASNKTPDGSTFTVVFNAEGILQAADG